MLFIISILHQLLDRLYIYKVLKVRFDYSIVRVGNYHYSENILVKGAKVRR
jgi:hypothetical protein